MYSHPDYQLDKKEEDALNACLSRLMSREPLAYITGIQSFFGLEFNVTPHVLIPRPETELLVEQVILAANHFQHPLTIADVGTGSGCISITLAKSLSSARIFATDISLNALRVAKENIQRHQVGNHIHLIQTSLLNSIHTNFHIICANLPYIPTEKLCKLSVLNYEPRLALDGGKDGLVFIRQLFQVVQRKLHKEGVVIIEIEHTQESSIINIYKQLLPSASCTIINDLAGFPRVAVIRIDG